MEEQIRALEDAIAKLRREFNEHRHTGLDSKQVDLSDSVQVQGSITAENTSTVDTTYGAEEAAVISNTRTRVGQIEDALIAFGILE